MTKFAVSLVSNLWEEISIPSSNLKGVLVLFCTKSIFSAAVYPI
jgi:hypothetical protein